jgi:hypothetical protein
VPTFHAARFRGQAITRTGDVMDCAQWEKENSAGTQNPGLGAMSESGFIVNRARTFTLNTAEVSSKSAYDD